MMRRASSGRPRFFSLSRFVGLAVVLGWLVILFQLYAGTRPLHSQALEELFPWAIRSAPQIGEAHFGIFLKGLRIGSSSLIRQKSASGMQIRQAFRMEMDLLGSPQKVSFHSSLWMSPSLQIKHFASSFQSPLRSFRAEGTVTGSSLVLEMQGPPRRRRTLPYRPAVALPLLRSFVASSRPKVGHKFRSLLFDLQSLSYQKIAIEVLAYEEITIQGRKKKAIKLLQDFQGMLLHTWIDDEGDPLKEEGPGGLLFLREFSRPSPFALDAPASQKAASQPATRPFSASSLPASSLPVSRPSVTRQKSP